MHRIKLNSVSRLAGYLLVLLLTFKSAAAQPAPEFRGVWIATVDNIDWPSKGNFDGNQQKEEFIKLLDFHQRNGLNAVIVQIRPCGDALYPSQYEPWSEWLTGKQGTPPRPYYDPLEFMITETHKRKMAFHAWMNPYRAEFNTNNNSTSATHITRLHPDWFITYGDKKYFDPGRPEVQNYVTAIVQDVVNRYAIDAIHFDDYFYPYTIDELPPFNDKNSFRQYGNGLSLDNWRRSNTDSIIVKISRAIHAINPKCKFGISPFGVWRNKNQDPDGSNTRGALSNYDDLYADILKWLRNDWIDYVAPQLYWEFGHRRAAYEVLLEWWSRHTYGKHCYIGLGPYKANSNAAWSSEKQLPRQIEELRNTPNIQGMIFFSSSSLEKNLNGWADILRLKYFREPASVPEFR